MMCRAMEFLVELFHNLLQHPDWTMSQVCTDSYGKTLKQWHGWLASSSFSVMSLISTQSNSEFFDRIEMNYLASLEVILIPVMMKPKLL